MNKKIFLGLLSIFASISFAPSHMTELVREHNSKASEISNFLSPIDQVSLRQCDKQMQKIIKPLVLQKGWVERLNELISKIPSDDSESAKSNQQATFKRSIKIIVNGTGDPRKSMFGDAPCIQVIRHLNDNLEMLAGSEKDSEYFTKKFESRRDYLLIMLEIHESGLGIFSKEFSEKHF